MDLPKLDHKILELETVVGKTQEQRERDERSDEQKQDWFQLNRIQMIAGRDEEIVTIGLGQLVEPRPPVCTKVRMKPELRQVWRVDRSNLRNYLPLDKSSDQRSKSQQLVRKLQPCRVA